MQISWRTLVGTLAVAVMSTALLVREGAASAEEPAAANQVQEAKTKLEAFSAKSGVVVVRGFSSAGSVAGTLDSSVEVECKEFFDAAAERKEYGITVEVKQGREHRERKSTSYIDYDEIDSLLKGIDYISKIDKSVTKLSNFQADYRTRGDLEVSTYSYSAKEGTVRAAVKSGRIGGVLAFLRLEDLQAFRELVAKAKGTLDDLKK